MPCFFQVLDPAFFFLSRYVLDDGALDKPESVGQDVLNGLDGHFAVVIAADLMRKFAHTASTTHEGQTPAIPTSA